MDWITSYRENRLITGSFELVLNLFVVVAKWIGEILDRFTQMLFKSGLGSGCLRRQPMIVFVW